MHAQQQRAHLPEEPPQLAGKVARVAAVKVQRLAALLGLLQVLHHAGHVPAAGVHMSQQMVCSWRLPVLELMRKACQAQCCSVKCAVLQACCDARWLCASLSTMGQAEGGAHSHSLDSL